MSEPAGLCLRIPPALAGGRLLWLNRIFHLCAVAQAQGKDTVDVAFDEQLLTESDTQLLLLDAKGSPIRMDGPAAQGWSEAERAAVFAAARDRIPATAESEPSLQRFLPRPEESLLEAALELWIELFDGLDLGVSVRFQAVDAASQQWPTVEDFSDAPVMLWLSSRHRQTMRELGIELDWVLEGEEALTQRMKERDQGLVREVKKRMRTELEQGLADLRDAIREESPGLLGSWNRYRRAAHDAAADFGRAADRFERNRKGIKGSRMHALAQAVRPSDLSQEEGLGLLCAVALFRLQPSDVVEQLELFHGPSKQVPNIVYSGIGISGPRSLS